MAVVAYANFRCDWIALIWVIMNYYLRCSLVGCGNFWWNPRLLDTDGQRPVRSLPKQSELQPIILTIGNCSLRIHIIWHQLTRRQLETAVREFNLLTHCIYLKICSDMDLMLINQGKGFAEWFLISRSLLIFIRISSSHQIYLSCKTTYSNAFYRSKLSNIWILKNRIGGVGGVDTRSQ